MPYPAGNDQFAIADRNQRDAITAHSGTADTAYPVRLVGENGALWTSIQGGTVQTSGTVSVSGTIPVSGTVGVSGTIPVSGTVSVAGTTPVSGTVGVSGTVPISGTVVISGTTPVSGTVTNNMSSGTLNAGTISFTPFALRIDAGTASGTITTYVGKADPGSNEGGSVWQIRRSIEVSGQGTIAWADGNGSFDNIWTGHGTLSYS